MRPRDKASATSGKPVREEGSTPRSLAGALALAQERCKDVDRDREGVDPTGKVFLYASPEAILSAAKVALSGTGLAFRPCCCQLVKAEGVAGVWFLRRHFELLHATAGRSDEKLSVETVWPVCQEPGRGLHQILAGALTMSLAYTLRDLLLMPRVDPDDDMDRPKGVAIRAEVETPAGATGKNAGRKGKPLGPYLRTGRVDGGPAREAADIFDEIVSQASKLPEPAKLKLREALKAAKKDAGKLEDVLQAAKLEVARAALAKADEKHEPPANGNGHATNGHARPSNAKTVPAEELKQVREELKAGDVSAGSSSTTEAPKGENGATT